MNRIPITKPSITELEISYVNDAIRTGWGSRCYDYIYRFERLFAEYIGTTYSHATSSCTGAIHLALLAMGVKAGDEVIIPDITWIASVEPILYIGATPVFVDVRDDSWCINPQKIEEAITDKTKAIVVVHLYGNLAEMDEIISIAKRHNLAVLEDAAEGLGSEYKGRRAGSIGDAGVFSFHGTKALTTGEGGIVVSNDEELMSRVRILNDHGRNPKIGKTFWMEEYGYKYKISNLQAALGCAQVERAEELISRKRSIFHSYKEKLKDFPGVMNPEPAGTLNSYWMPTIVFDKSLGLDRDALFSYLNENQIDSRPFFYPLSSLPMFKKVDKNSIAYDIFDRAVNLPSYHDMSEDDVEHVVSTVSRFISKYA
jgi:perosamine synthetase